MSVFSQTVSFLLFRKCKWRLIAHWMHMKSLGVGKGEPESIQHWSCILAFNHPHSLFYDCLSLQKLVHFLQVTKFIMFYKGNHSNSLLYSYANIGI